MDLDNIHWIFRESSDHANEREVTDMCVLNMIQRVLKCLKYIYTFASNNVQL